MYTLNNNQCFVWQHTISSISMANFGIQWKGSDFTIQSHIHYGKRLVLFLIFKELLKYIEFLKYYIKKSWNLKLSKSRNQINTDNYLFPEVFKVDYYIMSTFSYNSFIRQQGSSKNQLP